MAGIYVHIPFCARRCIYCGFFSTVRQEEAARYVDALCRELHERAGWLDGTPVRTVYFGGGTPSRLTYEQLAVIVATIKAEFNLNHLEEFTVECNPDDITPDYISALVSLGVNRISMGVQTFNDGLLVFLHRRHTAAQALNAVSICREAGVRNISIDLMYGLPGQTLEMFRIDLETALALGVRHISSYCLSYEEGTALNSLLEQGRIVPVSDELCAQMFSLMCSMLRGGGYVHYEISNFCRPGCHSRHNCSYWDGTPYLGVGAGAHSYNGIMRQWNPSDLDAYLSGMEQQNLKSENEILSATDRYNETVMLRLRTSQGLDLQSFPAEDRIDLLSAAKPFLDRGQLIHDGSFLRLDESSLFISDSIISSLFR